MAHLRSLVEVCEWSSSCTARASQQVYSTRNDPLGRYCSRHAKLALREQQAREDREAGR